MYEILIVDDSVLDIDCIIFLIKKFELPLHPVKAVNGNEALSLIKKKETHFDILLTDIKMPFMDGLELSREVCRLSPDTKIIIFSGFNDFEYAKSAISIGVKNYLLKPIVPADFESTIRNVITSIDMQRKQAEQQRLQTHIAKSHVLWQALYNTAIPEHMNSFLEPYYSIMLIECETDFFSAVNDDFPDKLNTVLSIPFDYLNLYPSRSLLFVKKNLKDTYLLAAAQSICLLVTEDYAQKCFVTFDKLPDNSHIARVYSLLEKKIESRFFFPDQNILLPNDPCCACSPAGHISVDILADDLKLQDYDTLDSHLEEIFDSLKNNSSNSLIYVKYCFTEMVKVLIRATGSTSWNMDGLAEKIYGSSNILELIDMVRSLSASIRKNTAQEKTKGSKTEKIRQYIYQNYARPLTLDEISSHFYLSPNYLCSVFKKENGCNLNKFINDYRLKRAAELLTNTQMKIHGVAEAVGFHNTSYFIQRFRDFYGETPDSYRQNHNPDFAHVERSKDV